MSRRHFRTRCGFVLIIVVLTLAIVCVLLMQLASISASRLQQSILAERRLREHCLVTSVRQTLLSRAKQTFEKIERIRNSGPIDELKDQPAKYEKRIEGTIEIGGTTIEITLQDESAKLSIANLFRTRGPLVTHDYLEGVATRHGVPIRREIEGPNSITGEWSHACLFDLDHNALRQIPIATTEFTVWGNGRLNLFRANEQTIESLWRELYGRFPPRELFEARLRYPKLSWNELRTRLRLRDPELNMADAWFDTESQCFSLHLSHGYQQWIFASDSQNHHWGLEL